jgi:hypothetical protein
MVVFLCGGSCERLSGGVRATNVASPATASAVKYVTDHTKIRVFWSVFDPQKNTA